MKQNPDKRLKYLEFVDIYTALDNNERQAFERQYLQEEATVSSHIANVRKEGIQEGMEKGIEKGIEKGRLEGIERGRLEGIEKGKLEMAQNLLAQDLLSDEQIASVSGLPLARIQALRNQNQQQH